MNQLFSVRLVTTVCSLAVFAGLAGATPIGTLNVSGTARVTLTGLDFFPVGPTPIGSGTGNIFTLPGANTGTFTTLNVGGPTVGTITDRSDTTQPVGPVLSVTPYFTLSAIPTLVTTLTRINPGSFSSAQCFLPAANQQTCTLPPVGSTMSPYELTNTISSGVLSSTATFSVTGTATDGVGMPASFIGRFDANFLGVPYQTLLAAVQAPGGFVDAPFTATFTFTPIPEPGTAVQLISGLALAGLAAVGKSRLRR